MRLWRYNNAIVPGDKYLVVRRDGTVPAWPHFVLGARDPYAPTALRAYAHAAEIMALKPDEEFVKSVFMLADEFDAYCEAHGLGDPEAGPHRQDQFSVVTAMKGYNAFVQVKPDKK